MPESISKFRSFHICFLGFEICCLLLGIYIRILAHKTSDLDSIKHFFHIFKAYLSKSVHPSSLGLFRILFGCTMFVQIAYFIATDFVQTHISKPIIHFPYYFFQFVVPLPSPFMDVLMWLMLAAAAMIAAGFLYRYAVALFLMSFTYLWLIDKGFFNNHYYLITLLCILLLLVRGDAWAVLWKRKSDRKKPINYIPNWQIFILKAQIFIVFFVAGIHKINPYWLLHFQPMEYILHAKADISGLAFLRHTALAAFFSYGGLIVDISIGFLLWWKRSRMIGIFILIAFNFLNFWLFWNIGEIGIFPLLLLSTIVLFLEPDRPARWLGSKPAVHSPQPAVHSPPFISSIIIIYLLFHLLFPFRHLLYPGHVDWTGEGQRFAWRMKIMLKEADIHFFIKDDNGDIYPVPVNKMLSPKQYNNLIYYPDLIPPIARAMKKQAIKQGITARQVVADFKVKFMGVHPAQAIVSPDTDLTQVRNHPFLHSQWIMIYD